MFKLHWGKVHYTSEKQSDQLKIPGLCPLSDLWPGKIPYTGSNTSNVLLLELRKTDFGRE